MANYVLGVDGGATKTHCAIFDGEGTRIDFVHWGPMNHESMAGGFEELEERLNESMDALLVKNGIRMDEIDSAVFGLAGVDTREQHEIISGILHRAGFQKFVLCNDAFLGIKAGSRNGSGICVINGTGNTIAGIDSSGHMLQIGGQGDYTGDTGGGGLIAAKGVKAVYNHLFKCGDYTIMVQQLMDRLGVTSKYDLIETLLKKEENEEISRAELCQMVFLAANKEDIVALGILEHIGRDCGRAVKGMLQELYFDPLETIEVILAGSVSVKGENATLVDYIKREARMQGTYKNLMFSILEKPPVTGAILWAFEELYGSCMEEIREKILTQMQGD